MNLNKQDYLDEIFSNKITKKIEKYKKNKFLYLFNLKLFFLRQLLKIKKKIFTNDKNFTKFINEVKLQHFKIERLIQLKEIILKKKPKIIVEFGAGISTYVISYYINKYNIDSKIITFEKDKSYLDKIKKNLDQNILKNIDFKLTDIEFFSKRKKKFISHKDSENYLKNLNIDFCYIDGPVVYNKENYKNTISGDLIKLFENKIFPRYILLDGKYDLYRHIKYYSNGFYNKKLNELFFCLEFNLKKF